MGKKRKGEKKRTLLQFTKFIPCMFPKLYSSFPCCHTFSISNLRFQFCGVISVIPRCLMHLPHIIITLITNNATKLVQLKHFVFLTLPRCVKVINMFSVQQPGILQQLLIVTNDVSCVKDALLCDFLSVLLHIS